MSDILERAKKALIDDDMTYEDYNECISSLIAEAERKNEMMNIVENTSKYSTARLEEQIEALVIRAIKAERMVERLRSENDGLKELVDCMLRLVHSEVSSYDKLSRLSIKAIETVMDARREQREKVIAKDARIKELEARLAEIEEDGDCLTVAYLLGGKKKADENKVLIAYVKRLETEFLKAILCPSCNGKGVIRYTVMHRVKDRMEDMSFNQTCPLCGGKGEQKAREALERIKEGQKG